MSEPPGEKWEPGQYWREYAKVVAKSWADPEFARLLRANPTEVLRGEGLDVPEKTKIIPTETDLEQNGRNTYYFLLPPKPRDLEESTSVESLIQVVAERAVMATCHTFCSGGGDCGGGE
jgi:hypothetical protein